MQGRTVSSPETKVHKLATPEEMIRFYGMIMLMENTFGNNTGSIRTHFKMIVQNEGKIPKLGLRRFEILWRNLNPSIVQLNEVANLFHTSSMR
jgi:uncharacterized Fe-S cluster-containing radical SAM superfamily enzyme